ncbi:hypothetical protein C8Q75DRAFT_781758 [Abortiporus biennis]|nr:hypothetical protein C8Q75DRAFT_781758 [Abortiporus biennis]
MSISLVFTPALRVGGEVISGEVELHFPQVHEDEIEEVHVKLRGQVYAFSPWCISSFWDRN